MFGQRRTVEAAWVFRIVRRDGAEHVITNHDQTMHQPFRRWNPARADAGLRTYAHRKESGISENTTQLSGLVTTDTSLITIDTLRAGRLRGATVFEGLHSWKYPDTDAWLYDPYDVQDVDFNEHEWTLHLTSYKGRLNRKVGDVLLRTCRNQLGIVHIGPKNLVLSACTKSISGYPFRVPMCSIATVNSRRNIEVSKTGTNPLDDSVHVDGYFSLGYIRVTSGANAGALISIESSTPAATTSQIIELVEPAPLDFTVGDQVEITVGCDKQQSTCFTKFNNIQDFRGEPYIPGMDAILRQGSTAAV